MSSVHLGGSRLRMRYLLLLSMPSPVGEDQQEEYEGGKGGSTLLNAPLVFTGGKAEKGVGRQRVIINLQPLSEPPPSSPSSISRKEKENTGPHISSPISRASHEICVP